MRRTSLAHHPAREGWAGEDVYATSDVIMS
jgi:hypothetical protein